ncbi:MAG: hypothetical protein ACI8QZ_002291 [Chlamydiales bacterium]|jgi:hypothetical protein
MGRIARSWRLLEQSYGMLKQDRELMLLPLISLVAIGAVLLSFVLGMSGLGLIGGESVEAESPVFGVAAFAYYVITYTIAIFFQAAVIAGATERMRGGDPTVRSSIAAAYERLPVIVVYGLIAATVGMLIRSVQERSEMVGRIVMGLIGMVWSLAVFYMVPVLVLEREGVGPSFKRSWAVFKRTWGETVVGSFGFGWIGVMLGIPIVLVAILLMKIGLPLLAIVIGGLGGAALGLFLSTLQGIWVASLYRYATEGEVPRGYDRALLEGAFRQK